MKNGFPAPNKELQQTKNDHLTGKAPYKFESSFLHRRVACELPLPGSNENRNREDTRCLQRDRWFESGSLQRRVSCELAFLDQAPKICQARRRGARRGARRRERECGHRRHWADAHRRPHPCASTSLAMTESPFAASR